MREHELFPDEAQKLPVQIAASLSRAEHGGPNIGAVGIADSASRLDIGPIDREGGNHLAQRIAQVAARMIAMAPVALADVRQQRRETLHLGPPAPAS